MLAAFSDVTKFPLQLRRVVDPDFSDGMRVHDGEEL